MALEKDNYKVHIPELIYTTDNAAMIGLTAYYKYLASKDKDYFSKESLSVKARPRLDFKNF